MLKSRPEIVRVIVREQGTKSAETSRKLGALRRLIVERRRNRPGVEIQAPTPLLPLNVIFSTQ
jgi:hypothetical protein